MKVMTGLAIGVLVTSGIASVAYSKELSPPAVCEVEGFKMQEADSVRQQTYVSFLDLVTNENFSQMQHDFQSSWTGPYGFFKTNYTDLDTKRKQYRKEINYHRDSKYSRDYAISTLNEAGLAAYKACLEHQSPSNSLIVALLENTPVGDRVSFEVAVHSSADLRPPFVIDVYGGALAATDTPDFRQQNHIKSIHPDRANDLVTIKMEDDIKKAGPYTFKRDSIYKEFRVIPKYASLDVHVLHIPPTLKTKVSTVPLPLFEGGEIKLTRPPDRGGNFLGNSFRTEGASAVAFEEPNKWATDPKAPPVPDAPYVANFCLCASGKHPTWSGRCVLPTGSELEKLGHLKGVTAATSPEPCRKIPLEQTLTSPYEVCFRQELRMSGVSGNDCVVQWKVEGKLLVQTEVFVGN